MREIGIKTEISIILLIIVSSISYTFSSFYFQKFDYAIYEFLFIAFFIMASYLLLSHTTPYKNSIIIFFTILFFFYDLIWNGNNWSFIDYSKDKYLIRILFLLVVFFLWIKIYNYVLFKKTVIIFFIYLLINQLLNLYQSIKIVENYNYNLTINYNNNCNTYLIVLDEYGSDNEILKEFGYNNKNKIQLLKKHNFIKSKFISTPIVISSLFNNIEYKNCERFKGIYLSLIHNNQIISNLKEKNIKIENFSLFDFKNNKSKISYSRANPYRQNLLLSNSIIPTLYNKLTAVSSINEYKAIHIDKVHQLTLNHINNISNKSFFVYSHYFLPHPPLIYDSLGNIVKEINQMNNSDYINNVKYANKIIGEIVSNFEKSNKKTNSKLIIFGDHKFRGLIFDKYYNSLKKDNFVQFLYYTPSNYKLDSNKEYSLNEAVYEILKH
jgi:hypothetical protein